MRDFDEGKPDLEFKIGGESFTAMRVRPEVLASWSEINDPLDDTGAALRLLDERVLSFLPEAERERWTALRAREEDPVTIGQMNALLQWMLETSSDLPTTPPLPSAAGHGATGG